LFGFEAVRDLGLPGEILLIPLVGHAGPCGIAIDTPEAGSQRGRRLLLQARDGLAQATLHPGLRAWMMEVDKARLTDRLRALSLDRSKACALF